MGDQSQWSKQTVTSSSVLLSLVLSLALHPVHLNTPEAPELAPLVKDVPSKVQPVSNVDVPKALFFCRVGLFPFARLYIGPSPDVLGQTVFVLANLQMCKIQGYGGRRLEGGGCQRCFRKELADGREVVIDVVVGGRFLVEESGC